MGAVDVPALLLAIVLSAGITGAVAFFANTDERRDWLKGLAIALVVMAIGTAELSRETPRETHWATWIFGATLPVAGAMGTARAMRAFKAWQRWPLAFLVAFLLLFGGLLLGSAVLPRFLGA